MDGHSPLAWHVGDAENGWEYPGKLRLRLATSGQSDSTWCGVRELPPGANFPKALL